MQILVHFNVKRWTQHWNRIKKGANKKWVFSDWNQNSQMDTSHLHKKKGTGVINGIYPYIDVRPRQFQEQLQN